MSTNESAQRLALKHSLYRELIAIKRETIVASELTDRLPDSNFVVAHSAPQTNGELDYLKREGNEENTARIKSCVKICRLIAARRCGKPENSLTDEDLLIYSSTLILSGETEQLPAMTIRAPEKEFPEAKIVKVNSGDRGRSHTGTQFQTLNDFLKENMDAIDPTRPVILVTSPYHQLRVGLTAEKKLDSSIPFVVLGADYEPPKQGLSTKTWGELERLKRYIDKGDTD